MRSFVERFNNADYQRGWSLCVSYVAVSFDLSVKVQLVYPRRWHSKAKSLFLLIAGFSCTSTFG